MIDDMLTILWKESKELLFLRGNMRNGWLSLLIFVGVFGVFLPIQNGAGWVENPANLLMWGWLPFLLVTGVIADSFAGERERHTLETLLASRLSDRAILFGKISAAIAYAWGLTIVSVLLGVVVVNVVHGGDGLLFYPPQIFLSILVLTFLVALLASGLGVVISLRAATVRQAQQTFSAAFFLLLAPLFILPLLPDDIQLKVAEVASGLDIEQLVLVGMGVLTLLDLALLGLALARFRRSRLILD